MLVHLLIFLHQHCKRTLCHILANTCYYYFLMLTYFRPKVFCLIVVCAWVGAVPWLWCAASCCSGFSCCASQALGLVGLSVVTVSDCSSQAHSVCTQAGLSCVMWHLPGSGIEPILPAMYSSLLTEAPGSLCCLFDNKAFWPGGRAHLLCRLYFLMLKTSLHFCWTFICFLGKMFIHTFLYF